MPKVPYLPEAEQGVKCRTRKHDSDQLCPSRVQSHGSYPEGDAGRTLVQRHREREMRRIFSIVDGRGAGQQMGLTLESSGGS